MAFGMRLFAASITTMFLMLAFVPAVQSSPPRSQGRKVLEVTGATIKQDVEGILEKGGSSTRAAEVSAREVPTGPDPIHHNNSPIKP